MYNYTVYGLSVASEVECRELIPGNGNPDVFVRYGTLVDIPASEERPLRIHVISEKQMFLNIKNTARYLVSGGREIIIDKYPKADDNAVRYILLGSVFGAVLHQRGFLPLHGNGILHRGECIAFSGRSRIGKSTLAAAFRKRGYMLLADDVCSIKTYHDRKATIFPGCPHIRIRRSAADKLGEDLEKLERLNTEDEKYVIPVRENHCSKPAPLNRIYILGIHNEYCIKFVELDNIERIKSLQNNIYRKGILKQMCEMPRSFRLCGGIARYTTVKAVLRPANAFLLDELVDMLEEDFK